MVRLSDLSLLELEKIISILMHETLPGLEDRLQQECIQSVKVRTFS
jgi:hypothetical protein